LTVELISRASKEDNRIVVQTFENPVSINENFNRAIRITTNNYLGEFIGFIGGDDFLYEETYLANLITTLRTDCSMAIPRFKIQEKISVNSYFASYFRLSKFAIVNRIMQGWDSNYGNLFYSLFRWDDFICVVSDNRSKLNSNLTTDWWFVNTTLRLIRYPPKFVSTATYIKINKGYNYDSEYYQVVSVQVAGIGVQKNSGFNSRMERLTFLKRMKIRFENVLIVPTLIIYRERNRIKIIDYPEFILVWIVMVVSRAFSAYKSYSRKNSGKSYL
jgi:hypothetical protein